jgi:hypothetical protein
MSSRRQAKAWVGMPSVRTVDGAPACLKVGACIDVWAPGTVHRSGVSAWRSFTDVRE